ncbi:hypothetical protein L3Q82_013891 [Scortum barcoo]|uniref:Uncharacterized protein n=1 Tax=Scortum barcoo TaxID=214431 RepID=A0ACB8VVG0_9TELE|nr:hypothetical protein L3Q82_013891 [Scortum barcoo]
MSADRAASPCNKFQANIFNKTKCQNCFKSRELHPLTDHDLEQAKPIYGGWLCLAPEGTDFDNPMQRSRKWQRRFFILHEHGSLSFALDELPSTLPQGTVNMNLCSDIGDAEPRTGQRNALCIVTPEQEIFIRGDNKEIINGWSEQLTAFLRTNKQNQKKKRKVERVAAQEPSPAKMAATDPSFPSSESVAESVCGQWQEDQQGRGPAVTPVWTDVDPPGLEKTPTGNASTHLCPVSRDSLTSDGGFVSPVGSLDLVVGRNTDNQPTDSNNIQTSANNKNKSPDRRRTERLLGSDASEEEQEGGPTVSRKGRSEARKQREFMKLQSCGDIAQLTAPPPQRRAKSLDRRTSDTVMTPDLLNFKKGWMVKRDKNEQWKKYWFVLSADSLRYYKDSMAEEASDLEGEIDLTKCFNVSEYQVQRNYGFQIHTLKGVYTLSAMTAGIRKNWIQALMKNVRPANAPDVARQRDPRPKHRSVTERRREGRNRTFDWAEFRPQKKPNPEPDPRRSTDLGPLELGDLERRKRRDERRRRYESMLGFSLGRDQTGGVRALSPKSQQKVEEEIEDCWTQVEKTLFRPERTVPLFTETRNSEEAEKLLDSYRKRVEDLKAQLAESERHRLELEAQLSPEGFYQQQLDPPSSSEADICPSDVNKKPFNSHAQTLKDVYKESRELLQQQNIIRQEMQEQLSFEPPSLPPQTPSIWLHNTEGNFQELSDLLPASPLSSPESDSQHLFSQSDGETTDFTSTNHQNQLHRDDREKVPSSETRIKDSKLLILEKPADREENLLTCCEDRRLPPDEEAVTRLSREVELLTSQNEALNQRNQEMLNQLTEADREIERLKAELSGRYTEPRHLPEVEQTGVEDLEGELSLRNQQHLEALTLIASLEENLKETEALLQLNKTEEAGLEERESTEKEEGYLLRCLEAAEAKLTELEKQLDRSEETCRELQTQNAELMEAEKLYRHQTAAEAEADIRRLNQELEEERLKDRDGNKCVSREERIQDVIEGMVMRLNALETLLEVIDKLDVGLRRDENKPTVRSQLKWEEEFWSSLLDKMKPSHLNEEEVLLSEATERLMVEKQVLRLGFGLLSEADLCTDEGRESLDINWNIASVTSTETETTATEALYCCRLTLLHSRFQRRLEETNQKLLTSSLICSSCVDLMEENRKLREKLSNLEEELVDKMNACCQIEETFPQDTDQVEDANVQPETPEEETFESLELEQMEILPPCVEGQSGIQQVTEENTQKSEASDQETDLSLESEQVLELRRRVEELEEQLAIMAEEMKEEFDGKMSSVQMQHEREMEKLKVMCERGFVSMEESHLKVVEELQRRTPTGSGAPPGGERQTAGGGEHRDRNRKHQERNADAAYDLQFIIHLILINCIISRLSAIEAIKNAHRLELQREVQKRCESENRTGNAQLENIYRQHGEELASYQQELQVLSQQFSVKCLENGHLVQALDAERKALCQCQQENQDLRTRNQELSGHLAAEITRLCSLAKQDALPLSQGMDVYEMEITLRVKESEVQSLKQEITSLKDELQSAQKDKRNATKKYKDMYAELNILRVKTEREVDGLRENLRLAHRALDQSSP